MHVVVVTRISDLIIVIVVIQTATFLQWDTVPSLEDKTWFAEAATDAGARAVGRRLHTGGDTSWTTFYILCIRRAGFCKVERKVKWYLGKM